MKILLINSNTCTSPYPVYPLGMGVAAEALFRAGHTVEQFDLLASGFGKLEELLRNRTFGLIGISIRNVDTVNSCAPDETIIRTPLAVVKLCRKFGKTPILLGGAGFSLLPEQIMRWTGADCGVAGEGESAIVKAAAVFESGARPEPKILREPVAEQLPARYDPAILGWYARKVHTIPVQTKRGCPFRCLYCTYPMLEGNRFRKRPSDSVIPQIAELHEKYPECMFYFVDSVLNDPAGEYLQFLSEMKKFCGPVPFGCFLTPFRLDDSGCRALRSAGMIAAELGIDAMSDPPLAGLEKPFTFAEAKRCVKTLCGLKTGLSCSVMAGGPGETYDTLREGIANVLSLEPAFTGVFSGIRILPGTKIFELAEAEEKVPADWNGIDSLFYYAPGLDPAKVDSILREGFAGSRFCAYPPDRFDHALKTIHKIGYPAYRKFTGIDP